MHLAATWDAKPLGAGDSLRGSALLSPLLVLRKEQSLISQRRNKKALISCPELQGGCCSD